MKSKLAHAEDSLALTPALRPFSPAQQDRQSTPSAVGAKLAETRRIKRMDENKRKQMIDCDTEEEEEEETRLKERRVNGKDLVNAGVRYIFTVE